jgi:DNA-binding beta-propeller fold protein YncE
MYVREHANPFIHALNMDGFALCLDLRGTGYGDDDKAMQWSLAMSPDGGTLYAVNLGSGEIAVVSVARDSPQIVRTGRITLNSKTGWLIKDVTAKEIAVNAAVVSPDGKTLVVAGSSGVAWIDTDTLTVRKRALETWRIWGLGLSPDGQSLYAVADVGTIAELSMASGEVGERFDLGTGQPIALMRVAAA